MYVCRSGYRNFRNIEEGQIEFCPGVNILIGGNAEGKTSAIEGIYLCSAGRSHRTVHENEFIKDDSAFANCFVEFIDNRRKRRIETYFIRGGKKSCMIEGAPVKKMSEFVGIFKSVLFCPEHLSIVKAGPLERRNFIDLAISRNDTSYMKELQNYHKGLMQRNKILSEVSYGRMSREEAMKTIPIWSELLSESADKIVKKRNEYIELLNKYLLEIFSDMTGGKEKPELIYKSDGEKDELLKKLTSSYDREFKAGTTLFGIHREDAEIQLNGRTAKIYGSQGQQRSIAIALKLSEGEICRDACGEYPVYLLDDILSELDGGRREYIMSGFSNGNRQVIITCCDENLLKNDRFMRNGGVMNGEVRRIRVEKGSYCRL